MYALDNAPCVYTWSTPGVVPLVLLLSVRTGQNGVRTHPEYICPVINWTHTLQAVPCIRHQLGLTGWWPNVLVARALPPPCRYHLTGPAANISFYLADPADPY